MYNVFKLFEYIYNQLISDFSNPGDLINAKNSTFLVSKNLPSPMGAFLSGFTSEKVAQLKQEEHGGILYNWTEIQKHINKN